MKNRNKMLFIIGCAIFLIFSPGQVTAGSRQDLFEKLILKSETLKETREISIILPDSYRVKNLSYPLLIVLDGEDFLHPTGSLLKYYHQIGLAPEMIQIGIKSQDRWKDFTPTHANIPDGTPLPTSGSGDQFFLFLKTELLPALEKKYRLTPFRLIFGHSIAGLFATHYLISQPDFFSGAIATSPSLWWDNEITTKLLKESKIQCNNRLFLSIGNEGPTMETPIRNLLEALNGKKPEGFSFRLQSFPGVSHQAMPAHALAPAIEHIFSPWRISPSTLDSGLEGVKNHYQQLSKWMKEEVKIPEGILNRLGYMELRKGKLPEAIRIFSLNVKLHPQSANVYDSLGEALFKNGQMNKALTSFKKALKINPDLENSKNMIQKIQNTNHSSSS